MAILGIWLWSDPRSFGTASSSSCATEYAYLAILGRPVRLGSYTLRIASLVVYAWFTLPGVNLSPPMAIFLAAYFGHHNCVRGRRLRLPGPLRYLGSPVLAIRAGLTLLLVVNVIFIIDIELTLRMNYDLQGGEDEEEWRFGQILAMLLVSMPLRDLIETILARREKRVAKRDRQIRRHEVNNDLKKAIHAGESSKIMRLIQSEGADPNVATEGEFGMLIMIVKMLIKNATVKDGRTALEVMASAREWDSVKTLIATGADLNTEFKGILFSYAAHRAVGMKGFLRQ